jgi:hypothetical protein
MFTRSTVLRALPTLVLLCSLHAQTKSLIQPRTSAAPKTEKSVDVIVRVDAYDWVANSTPNGFGHQFDSLIVRVEKVVSGGVFEPWVRVDYWGSNRHYKEDRLPDEIFEPGHRWKMRLSPMRISEKNYQYCRPGEAGTFKNVDQDGNVISESNAIRAVSAEFNDFPDIRGLKCYALRREGLHEATNLE